MNAVLQAREPSAKYLANAAVQTPPPLVRQFDLLATAPGGMARLRELILTLAVQGKLVPQDPSDEPASVLLQKIRAEKERLIAERTIRREKQRSPIEDAEYDFTLPKGWEWIYISDVAWPQAGFAFKSGGFNEVGEGMPLIRIRDVGGNAPTTFFAGDFRDEFVVSAGDWLIGMDGDFRIREWHGSNALLNQRVARLVFIGNFVKASFVSASLQRELSKLQGQKAYTTVDHLSGGQISEAVIALPPAMEQSRIVARVEELMRLCDALESQRQLETAQHAQLLNTLLGTLTDSTSPDELAANWLRVSDHFDLLLDRPEAVDALEQTILQLAVRGLLAPQDPSDEPASVLLQGIRAKKDQLVADGRLKREKPIPKIAEEERPFDLPEGWQWVRMIDVAEANTGFAFKSSQYTSSGTLVFRVTNIRPDGSVDLVDPKYIDPYAAATTYRTFSLNAGDVLLVMVGGSLGKIGIVDADCLPAVLNQNMWKIVISDDIDREYFIYFLRYVNKYQIRITHSTHGHLAQGEYFQQLVAMPPRAEQSRIVARISQLSSLCADLRQRLSARQATQSHLAEALVEV
jgi:type I restriction enzyme S subunit